MPRVSAGFHEQPQERKSGKGWGLFATALLHTMGDVALNIRKGNGCNVIADRNAVVHLPHVRLQEALLELRLSNQHDL